MAATAGEQLVVVVVTRTPRERRARAPRPVSRRTPSSPRSGRARREARRRRPAEERRRGVDEVVGHLVRLRSTRGQPGRSEERLGALSVALGAEVLREHDDHGRHRRDGEEPRDRPTPSRRARRCSRATPMNGRTRQREPQRRRKAGEERFADRSPRREARPRPPRGSSSRGRRRGSPSPARAAVDAGIAADRLEGEDRSRSPATATWPTVARTPRHGSPIEHAARRACRPPWRRRRRIGSSEDRGRPRGWRRRGARWRPEPPRQPEPEASIALQDCQGDEGPSATQLPRRLPEDGADAGRHQGADDEDRRHRHDGARDRDDERSGARETGADAVPSPTGPLPLLAATVSGTPTTKPAQSFSSEHGGHMRSWAQSARGSSVHPLSSDASTSSPQRSCVTPVAYVSKVAGVGQAPRTSTVASP